MSAVIRASIFLILCVIVSSSSNLKSSSFNVNTNLFKVVGKCHERACQPADKGGIISATSNEYETIKTDVLVYRIFTDPKTEGKAGKYGAWWSLTKPSGSKANYMTQNAICPEFNNMTHFIVCALKKGVRVSIGPTQSIQCAKSIIAQNPKVMQVYIASVFGKTDDTIFGKDGPFVKCQKVEKSPLS